MRSGAFCREVLLLSMTAYCAIAAFADASITVSVKDEKRQVMPGVQVQVRIDGHLVSSATTGEDGGVVFPSLPGGRWSVTAAKEGFATVARKDGGLLETEPVTIDLTMVPAARRDSVEVKGEAAPLEQGAAPPMELPARTAREMPSRPATVADALPMVPGVVRSPGGGLQLSGSGEHRSALMVNSADVTDPATGQFGLTVPIDIVQTLNVYQTPFLAEFG